VDSPNGLPVLGFGDGRNQVVAEAASRRPEFVVETVPEANHYTIVLADRFAARVAHHVET
jgi:hypothetical protein